MMMVLMIKVKEDYATQSVREEKLDQDIKTVEKHENKEGNLESSIFLALSKWTLFNSQSV